jgi:penicillin amidase
MLGLGQSGIVVDPHYDDFLQRWGHADYVPMRFSRAAVDAAIAERLTLTP